MVSCGKNYKTPQRHAQNGEAIRQEEACLAADILPLSGLIPPGGVEEVHATEGLVCNVIEHLLIATLQLLLSYLVIHQEKGLEQFEAIAHVVAEGRMARLSAGIVDHIDAFLHLCATSITKLALEHRKHAKDLSVG